MNQKKKKPHEENKWKILPLKEVAIIQTGVTKGKKNIKDSTTLPYLRVANVQDGYLDLKEIKKIKISKSDIDRYRLQIGDVLLTEGGDFDKLGRGSVWKGEIELCLHQNHIFVVRTEVSILIPQFFSYLSSSPYGKKYYLSCSKQTTNLASMNSTQLKAFPVPLPPLPEQKKIAAILSTWDRATSLTERLIREKKNLKKGLMERLLTGKVRFPEFVKSGKMQETKLGWIPAEWDVVRLGEVVDVTMGQSPTSKAYNERGEGLPLIQGNADLKKNRTFPKIWTTHITKKCDVGDIILTVRAPVGTVAKSIHQSCIGRGVCALKTRNGSSDFFYHYLIFYEPMWIKCEQGSTFTAINSKEIRDLKIPLPPLPEQKKIAAVLSACDREIELLRDKLSALKEEKRGLMQKLLTGEKRVKV